MDLQQLQLKDKGQIATTSWGVQKINAPAVWAAGTNGAGVKVAILDTGIDATHPDLNDLDENPATNDPKVVNWIDYINGNPVPYDDHGHGTHVSGTVSGTRANGQKTGVAPGSFLMDAKIWNSAGSGSSSVAIAAMQWALINGADVISMSGGWTSHVPAFTAPIDNLIAVGVVPVIAAGNEGGPSRIRCPADEFNAFAIGATDSSDVIAYFSSRGPVTLNGHTYIKPDVSAPGVSVLSTVPGGGYDSWDGTSMATPHVSGAIALMLQQNPALTPQQIKQTLENTSVGLGDPGKDNSYGTGRIDAYKAVYGTSQKGTKVAIYQSEASPDGTFLKNMLLSYGYNVAIVSAIDVENGILSQYDVFVYGHGKGENTQAFKDNIASFKAGGGGIITEHLSSAALLTSNGPNIFYPVPNWGWYQGIADFGGFVGTNTPINILDNSHPVFQGVSDPIAGEGSTEFFFTSQNLDPRLHVIAEYTGHGGTWPAVAVEEGAMTAVVLGDALGQTRLSTVNKWGEPEITSSANVISSQTSAQTVPIISDPAGDNIIEQGPIIDIIKVEGGSNSQELSFKVVFSNPMDVANTVGYISFDTDQNPGTGVPPSFGKPEQNIGADYEVLLFNMPYAATVDVYDTAMGIVTATVPVTFGANDFVFTVPLSVLGNVDGNIDVTMVLGDTFGPTDWAPDAGYGTIRQTGGKLIMFFFDAWDDPAVNNDMRNLWLNAIDYSVGVSPVPDILINSCTNISSPGQYALNKSIINSGVTNCINITSSNIILDGAGYTIDGNGLTNYGLSAINVNHITVKNLIVQDWNTRAVNIVNSNNNNFSNITVKSGNYDGFYLLNSNNNILRNITVLNTGNVGFTIDSSQRNDLKDSIFQNNAWEDFDIYLPGGVSGCNNEVSNVSLTQYQLYYSNKSVNLKDINAGAIYLCNADNSTVTNANVAANGQNSISNYYVENVTYSNITTSGLQEAIFFKYSANNNITNILMKDGWSGISYSTNTTNTNFKNATIYNMTDRAIRMYAGSSKNTISDSKVFNNSVGIYLNTAGKYGPNKIYNSVFNNSQNIEWGISDFFGDGSVYLNSWNTTKQPGMNIIGGSYLGGNFWAYPNGTGFSQICTDANGDGICDSTYTLKSNNIDYLPLALPSIPSITVVSPNGGNNWVRGSTQVIRWNYTVSPGPNVMIELLKNGVVNSVINSSTPIGSGGSGLYYWSIDPTLTYGSDYKLRITSTTNSTYTDTSNDNFTIRDPYVNLIKNGGFESGWDFWTFYSNVPGTFNIVSPGYEGNNSGMIKLNSIGSNMQFYQVNIPMQPNTRYRLSLAAKSTYGHDVIVKLFKHTAGSNLYAPDFIPNLTTSWQTFSTEFTSTGTAMNDARLMFWFVGAGAIAGEEYYFDSIILEKVIPPTMIP